jgi:hypothetical protein
MKSNRVPIAVSEDKLMNGTNNLDQILINIQGNGSRARILNASFKNTIAVLIDEKSWQRLVCLEKLRKEIAEQYPLFTDEEYKAMNERVPLQIDVPQLKGDLLRILDDVVTNWTRYKIIDENGVVAIIIDGRSYSTLNQHECMLVARTKGLPYLALEHLSIESE